MHLLFVALFTLSAAASAIDFPLPDEVRAPPKASVPTGAIDLKGFYIGMPEEAARARMPSSLSSKRFTIADVPSKYSTPSWGFHNGALDHFNFFFESDDFSKVFAAVRDKFPSITCEHSTVQNRYGAKFEQAECTLAHTNTILTLRRYVGGDLTTSGLSLYSSRYHEELRQRAARKSKDI